MGVDIPKVVEQPCMVEIQEQPVTQDINHIKFQPAPISQVHIRRHPSRQQLQPQHMEQHQDIQPLLHPTQGIKLIPVLPAILLHLHRRSIKDTANSSRAAVIRNQAQQQATSNHQRTHRVEDTSNPVLKEGMVTAKVLPVVEATKVVDTKGTVGVEVVVGMDSRVLPMDREAAVVVTEVEEEAGRFWFSFFVLTVVFIL